MKFIDWLESQAKIIGHTEIEIVEKSHMNYNVVRQWRTKHRRPTTGSIILIVKTISKLRKDITYRELILDAVKGEASR